MASHPKEEHTFILDSFDEFEALARRALHEGLNQMYYKKLKLCQTKQNKQQTQGDTKVFKKQDTHQTYKSIDILQEIAFGPRAQLSNEDIVSVLTSIKSIRICNLHDEV